MEEQGRPVVTAQQQVEKPPPGNRTQQKVLSLPRNVIPLWVREVLCVEVWWWRHPHHGAIRATEASVIKLWPGSPLELLMGRPGTDGSVAVAAVRTQQGGLGGLS